MAQNPINQTNVSAAVTGHTTASAPIAMPSNPSSSSAPQLPPAFPVRAAAITIEMPLANA